MFDPYSIHRLIQQHGQDTSFISRTTDGTYDPATGTNSGGTTTTYTVKGYFYNYKLDEINGTSVVQGDRKLVIQPTDTSGATIPEPKTNDTFVGVGDTVSVKSVDKLYSGTSVMVYMMQVGE